MKMELSQADVARCLNVSRSVVQQLWNQFQTTDSVSKRPAPSRPQVLPAEDRYLALSSQRRRATAVPQIISDHFVASGKRISATTVQRHLHKSGMYARRPFVCVPLNGCQRSALHWARLHVSWTRQ